MNLLLSSPLSFSFISQESTEICHVTSKVSVCGWEESKKRFGVWFKMTTLELAPGGTGGVA